MLKELGNFLNGKNAFWKGRDGKTSSARVYGGITILAALWYVQEIISMSTPETIGAAATAAGGLFIAIAGSAMVYMFQNKNKNEPVIPVQVDVTPQPLITTSTTTEKPYVEEQQLFVDMTLNTDDFYFKYSEIIDIWNELQSKK